MTAISKAFVQHGFQMTREILGGQFAKTYAIKIVQLWEMQYFEFDTGCHIQFMKIYRI